MGIQLFLSVPDVGDKEGELIYYDEQGRMVAWQSQYDDPTSREYNDRKSHERQTAEKEDASLADRLTAITDRLIFLASRPTV